MRLRNPDIDPETEKKDLATRMSNRENRSRELSDEQGDVIVLNSKGMDELYRKQQEGLDQYGNVAQRGHKIKALTAELKGGRTVSGYDTDQGFVVDERDVPDVKAREQKALLKRRAAAAQPIATGGDEDESPAQAPLRQLPPQSTSEVDQLQKSIDNSIKRQRKFGDEDGTLQEEIDQKRERIKEILGQHQGK